jgi:hypothetical protein
MWVSWVAGVAGVAGVAASCQLPGSRQAQLAAASAPQ